MDKKQFNLKIKRNLYFIYGIGYRFFGKKSIIDRPLYIKNKRFISIGERVCIHRGARIECFGEYSPNLVIGNDVGIGYNFQCLITDDCYIGDNTLMASNILITTENHGNNPNAIYAKQPLMSRKVSIGNNCWIGEKVIILPGVHLGDNVIVAAGSIVTKSFNSNSIIGGNPAKYIKIYDFKLHTWVKV